MSFVLIVTTEADDDAKNALNYYDDINPDLGDRFIDELHSTYQKLREHPQYYKHISKRNKNSFRYVKLDSFPFIVIYRTTEHTVVVNAVFNTHRKPKLG